MNELLKKHAGVITVLIETGLWVVYLILVCTGLAHHLSEDITLSRGLIGSAFIVYGGIYVYSGFFRHKGWRVNMIVDFASALVVLAIGIVILAVPATPALIVVVEIVFFSLLALRRIPSIIRNHKPRNIIACVLLWLTLSVLIAAAPTDNTFSSLCMIGMFVAIINIIAMAFSRIRLGILLKIMRKTYVSEILFGLVTLVVVFSYIFYMLETGFQSYLDAVWYSFAVITTIGFGDFTTTTIIGRTLSIILGLYGIIVVAAITSVIVNFYAESTKADGSDSKNRDENAGENPIDDSEIIIEETPAEDKKEEE